MPPSRSCSSRVTRRPRTALIMSPRCRQRSPLHRCQQHRHLDNEFLSTLGLVLWQLARSQRRRHSYRHHRVQGRNSYSQRSVPLSPVQGWRRQLAHLLPVERSKQFGAFLLLRRSLQWHGPNLSGTARRSTHGSLQLQRAVSVFCWRRGCWHRLRPSKQNNLDSCVGTRRGNYPLCSFVHLFLLQRVGLERQRSHQQLGRSFPDDRESKPADDSGKRQRSQLLYGY